MEVKSDVPRPGWRSHSLRTKAELRSIALSILRALTVEYEACHPYTEPALLPLHAKPAACAAATTFETGLERIGRFLGHTLQERAAYQDAASDGQLAL